jgi:hypothetical protein
MYHANPIQGKWFFLRLLLTIKRSSTSFKDLHFVNGVEHSTFQAACFLIVLQENAQESIGCFNDAIVWAQRRSLWNMSATALVHRGIENFLIIRTIFWQNFCKNLEKIIEVEGLSVPEGMVDPNSDWGLFLLEQKSKKLEKIMESYAFLGCIYPWGTGPENPQIMHIKLFNVVKEAELRSVFSGNLNSYEQRLFDTFKTKVDGTQATAHFFLEGAEGT